MSSDLQAAVLTFSPAAELFAFLGPLCSTLVLVSVVALMLCVPLTLHVYVDIYYHP